AEVPVLDLGAPLLRRTGRARASRPMARGPAARPRPPALARGAEPLHLLQPQHAPAGRGPRAVRGWAIAPRDGACGAVGRHGPADAPPSGRGPDRRRRRARGTVAALPSLRPRLLPPGPLGRTHQR